MGYVDRPRGQIKAPEKFSRTRAMARALVRHPRLDGRARFRAAEIASRPDDLTVADAWTINALAERARRAS